MDIEYDPLKAESNLKKHGVSFPDAISALYDPSALAMEDPFSEGEPWILIGQSKNARLLTVIYALRNEAIRIVSARPATRKEAKHYAR